MSAVTFWMPPESYPKLEAWMLDWVELIAELYHLNKQRLKRVGRNKKPGNPESRLQATPSSPCTGKPKDERALRAFTGSGEREQKPRAHSMQDPKQPE